MTQFFPDLEKMRAVWGGDPPVESLEDFFTVSVDLGPRTLKAPTHLFGDTLRIVPYHDADGEDHVRDAAGARYQRGDCAIADVVRPGALAFMLYHHRPEMCSHPEHGEQCGRTIKPPLGAAQMKAHLKLLDTHAGLAVGVADRGGAPGVVSVHNPQCYPFDKGDVDEKDIDPNKARRFGRFGDPAYSMVFFAPVFPGYIDAPLEDQFTANIRTMVVGFNAVAEYPTGSYDGADPLAADDVSKVGEHARHMVQAIGGDQGTSAEALAWFERPEHLIYCSELLHVATSAGLHFPLNAATFAPLVGDATWQRFAGFVESHARGEPTPFTRLNKNHLIKHIDIATADEGLQPVAEYAPPRHRDEERSKLAFKPLTAQEIIGLSLAELTQNGNSNGDRATTAAAVQVSPQHDAMGLLKQMSPEFVQSLGDTAATQRSVGECRPQQDAAETLFVPPTLLHYVAKKRCPGGLINLRYLGHGIHFSMVHRGSEHMEKG